LLARGVRPVTEGTPPSAPPALTAGAALSAVALVASLAYALAWGRPWDFAHPELGRVELADGFSVSLPAVRVRIDQSASDGVTTATFGDLYTDGAVYRVLLAPGDPGTVPDAARMEALKEGFTQKAIAGYPRQGFLAVGQLKGRPVVTDHAVSAGTRVREWSTYLGDHLVVLHAAELAAPDAAPWEDLAPSIFLSIEPPRR